MPTNVTVIDYGVGNLLSVRRGLEHCGADVQLTAEREKILAAERVILPGVGAYGNAIDSEGMHPFVEKSELHSRSQDLSPAYAINGGFYLIAPTDFRKNLSFYSSDM